ncbi:MAG: ATP-binding protein [Phycisphaerales bacterium]
MLGRISLATKCLLLFGAAVVLIIAAALAVPLVRMNGMVDDAEVEVSRQMVRVWEAAIKKAGVEGATAAEGSGPLGGLLAGQRLFLDDGSVAVITPKMIDEGATKNPFVADAWKALSADPKRSEFSQTEWRVTSRNYSYAKAVRGQAASLEGMIVLSRSSNAAARGMVTNTVFLVSAGCLALGLALLVFYLITSKIILSPVRDLRDTAEQVQSGNLDTRSDIKTGDEFEELAATFNAMLEAIQTGQNQLRSINSSLDQKLSELAERNVALYEAAKLKGEFLANVTHELRTPLNSILGFAELLDEAAVKEAESGDDSSRLAKRRRYIDNILGAGRSLLDLINGLLEMAKVDAGKVDLHIAPADLREVCEGLMGMMNPVADKSAVEVRLETVDAGENPVILTDRGKLQQVLFNLLSNAIKFTAHAAEMEADRRNMAEASAPPDAPAPAPDSRPALVILRLERLPARGAASSDRFRISVLDTGPGIAPDDQARIFEKFTQLDAGATRKHSGTGLGLAICKELTGLLQGEIHVHSELGRGSVFSVILPERLDPGRTAETKLELSFRGMLAGQR